MRHCCVPIECCSLLKRNARARITVARARARATEGEEEALVNADECGNRESVFELPRSGLIFPATRATALTLIPLRGTYIVAERPSALLRRHCFRDLARVSLTSRAQDEARRARQSPPGRERKSDLIIIRSLPQSVRARKTQIRSGRARFRK